MLFTFHTNHIFYITNKDIDKVLKIKKVFYLLLAIEATLIFHSAWERNLRSDMSKLTQMI